MSQPYLIIIMEGPMASFGTHAIDSTRPTGDLPISSMLTGLIANALGLRRTDASGLTRLQERISYAARRETRPGAPIGDLIDFQTAQLNRNDAAWTTWDAPFTRLGSPDTYHSPELRRAHYLADSRTVVALELREDGSEPTLKDVAHALDWPKRPLWIGRKTCPPTERLADQILAAGSQTEALYLAPKLPETRQAEVKWEDGSRHDSIPVFEERSISGPRDWLNRVHTGQRTVRRGIQKYPAGEKTT